MPYSLHVWITAIHAMWATLKTTWKLQIIQNASAWAGLNVPWYINVPTALWAVLVDDKHLCATQDPG